MNGVNVKRVQEFRGDQQVGLRVSTAVRIVLTMILYLSLWRATGMWYGYPAVFDEGLPSDPLPMKLVLYSIIPLICVYVWLRPVSFVSFIKSTPKLILGLSVISLASVLVSLDPAASIRGIAAVSVLTVGSLLHCARYGKLSTIRHVSNFMIFTAFFNIAYTIILPQYAVMGGSYSGMVKGAFYHKNGLGQFSSFAIIMLFANWPRFRGLSYRKVLTGLAILSLLVLIVASKSSTSLVMTFVGVAAVCGVNSFNRLPTKTIRATTFLSLMAIFVATVTVGALGVAETIADSFGKDLTFSGRTLIWDQLIGLIYQKPLLGYGFAIFKQPEVMFTYVNATFGAKSTHNTYLEQALNIGVPGLLLWMAFVVKRIFYKVVTRPKTLSESGASASDVGIIFLMLIGALMEAGVFLSPGVVWPFVVIALADTGPIMPAPQRKTKPSCVRRFYAPMALAQ